MSKIVVSALSTQVNAENNTRLEALNMRKHTSSLSKRSLKKLDKFTALSIRAIEDLIKQTQHEDHSQTGILIGNNYGGWSYVENQMYGLYRGDFDAINPYVATAWFPAAPQGEASILYGLGGYSKTFSSGDLSAAIAMKHAIHHINKKTATRFCAGGVEILSADTLKSALYAVTKADKGVDACAMFMVEQATSANKDYLFVIDSLSLVHGIPSLETITNASDKGQIVFYSKTLKNAINTPNIAEAICIDDVIPTSGGATFAVDIAYAYQHALSKGKAAIIIRKDSNTNQACLCQLSPNHNRTNWDVQ